MNEKQYDVCAFGEILIDFTEGETNDQGMKLFAQNPGGAPANVCCGISRLDGKAAFLGKAGQDMHGQFLKEVLNKENVDCDGLILDPDVFTTLAFVGVDEDGQRSFSFARKPGADTQMTFEQLDLDKIEHSKIFHIGSLSMTHEPSRSTTQNAIAYAKDHDVLVSYDPNYRDSLWSSEEQAIKTMRSLIPYADLMKISDEETELLTGHKDPEEAARTLLEQGVKLVCITLGKDGALAANKNGMVHVPGFKTSVADTNGAGDSFWAAMLTQTAQSPEAPQDLSVEDLEEMVRFANACASLTCSRPGAIPALPAKEEVMEFLNTKKEANTRQFP